MDARIEAALAAADLVQIAEQAGAKLHRQGSEYRGNCPLHGGHNPTGFLPDGLLLEALNGARVTETGVVINGRPVFTKIACNSGQPDV